jgi:hypothetical protein
MDMIGTLMIETERQEAPQAERYVAHGASGRRLTTAEANQFLGFAKGYLEKRRIAGDSPAYVQRSSRCAVKYRLEDLVAWEQSRVRHSTSEG